MCDEAMITRWAREGLSRRQFGTLGGIAVLAACNPGEGMADNGSSVPLTETTVSFATPDGTMDGFFVHPAEGAHPAVLLWPDIAGIREAKRTMARRLAGQGYAVLVANPYYRDAKGEIWKDFADFAGNDGWPRARAMREHLDAEAIMRDAAAAVGWLDTQGSVDTARGVGTQGYCMGGPFTFWTAAAVPGRVRAVASFHGGGLVREGDQLSPHALIGQTQASFLVAIGQNDDDKAPEEKTVLADAFKAAGRPAQVEVFDGDHGWTVPDSPVYAQAAAEKAWADLLALYEGAL